VSAQVAVRFPGALRKTKMKILNLRMNKNKSILLKRLNVKNVKK
jgi:hypothetical protein